MPTPAATLRCDWVDVAKGVCILLVVMFHATLGVEKATGEITALNAAIEWARPFRMPDFFFISGLFLAARIDRPWRSYLDSKVVHFAYFYLLWLHILLLVKAPAIIAESGLSGFASTYAWSYVDPFSSLWFIYLLAVYFVVTKLIAGLPKALVIAAAASLHVLWPETGLFLADEFANRFVFFYSGYALAPLAFRFAERVGRENGLLVLFALALWAITNAFAVTSGIAAVRGADLIVSFVGISAVIAASVMAVRSGHAAPLLYCGRNSIVIYLAFTLFMGPARQILLKHPIALTGEVIALASMAAGVIGALALHRFVTGTRAAFLFERPDSLKLPALTARWQALRHGSQGAGERAIASSKPTPAPTRPVW